AFPWPYGCSLSGGLLAIFTANKTTMDPAISEAECSASAIKARLPEMIPPIPFIIVSKTLTMIPIHVATIIGFVCSIIRYNPFKKYPLYIAYEEYKGWDYSNVVLVCIILL